MFSKLSIRLLICKRVFSISFSLSLSLFVTDILNSCVEQKQLLFRICCNHLLPCLKICHFISKLSETNSQSVNAANYSPRFASIAKSDRNRRQIWSRWYFNHPYRNKSIVQKFHPFNELLPS